MRLNRQTPIIKKLAEEILKETEALRSSLYWALDPEDKAMDWTLRLIEHAHALIDLGHEYKAAVRGGEANPDERSAVNTETGCASGGGAARDDEVIDKDAS